MPQFLTLDDVLESHAEQARSQPQSETHQHAVVQGDHEREPVGQKISDVISGLLR